MNSMIIADLDVNKKGSFFINAFNKPTTKKPIEATLLDACKKAIKIRDPDVLLIEIGWSKQGDGRFSSKNIEEILDEHASGWRPKKSVRRVDNL